MLGELRGQTNFGMFKYPPQSLSQGLKPNTSKQANKQKACRVLSRMVWEDTKLWSLPSLGEEAVRNPLPGQRHSLIISYIVPLFLSVGLGMPWQEEHINAVFTICTVFIDAKLWRESSEPQKTSTG